MKINRTTKKNNKRIIFIVASLLLVLALGALAYYKFHNDKNAQSPEKTISDSNKTDNPPNTQQSGNSSKDALITNTDNPDTDQTPAPQGVASLKVTDFSQNNGLVTTTVQATNTGSGKCVFTFTSKDARPVVREVSYTDKCESSIPSVEFSKIGIWSLNVGFFRNDEKITEVNQNVTIN